MSHKHKVIWLLIGWLIAVVFPPQALMGKLQKAR